MALCKPLVGDGSKGNALPHFQILLITCYAKDKLIEVKTFFFTHHKNLGVLIFTFLANVVSLLYFPQHTS